MRMLVLMGGATGRLSAWTVKPMRSCRPTGRRLQPRAAVPQPLTEKPRRVGCSAGLQCTSASLGGGKEGDAEGNEGIILLLASSVAAACWFDGRAE